MRTVTATDVSPFLGSAPAGPESVEASLDAVRSMVRRYTRGRGFDASGVLMDEDLAVVVVSSAARLAVNPALNKQMTSGPFAVTPGIFSGWTLAELVILNSYRKRSW